MTKVIALSLTFIYLIAMLRPAEPILEYCFNYQYIVTKLCVNKDKPQLKCNGKCYLMQQLKKQDSSEKNPKKTLRIQLENYPIGFVEITKIAKSPVFNFTHQSTFHYRNIYSFTEIKEHFHPPNFRI